MPITVYNDEGEPVVIRSHKEVCPRCHGEGQHVNPNIDGNGITADEMYELGEDFEMDYRSGVYDVSCEECGGQRVIDVADESDPNYSLYLEDMEMRFEAYQLDRMERMMGC